MGRFSIWVLAWGGCSGGDDAEPVEGDTFLFDGAIHTVVVSGGTGTITLTARPGDVEAEFITPPDGSNYQFDENAGRLTIGSVCQDNSVGCGTDIHIGLPAGTDFEVTSESGPVSITGMSVIGTVVTTDGSITARDLGPMDLSTTSLSGDHDLAFRDVPFAVDMQGGQSGNLTLEVPSGDYQIDITAGGVTQTSGVQDGPSGPELVLSTATGNATITGR